MTTTASELLRRATSPGQPALASRPPVARIVVGVDGFTGGRDAAALGEMLARVAKARLLLVAVHPAVFLPPEPQLGYRLLRKQAKGALRSVRDSLAPDARTLTVAGNSVPRALHRVAKAHGRDLVVMGSSRRSPRGRVRIGRRARQLLSRLDCPLAVAPRGVHEQLESGLYRIGVGYDGGPESEAALALAGWLACAAGARLHLCAVIDERAPLVAGAERSALGALECNDLLLAGIGQIRSLAHARLERYGVEFDIEIPRGRPADALLTLSETVDLLVIGSRRWSREARPLGSVGEALLHDAACAVLAVPRPLG